MTSPNEGRATSSIALGARAGRVGRFRGLFRFFRDKEASLWGKAFVVLTIAYVVWPLDLVPDALPILGWLDDLGLAGVASAYLFSVAGRYRDESPAIEARKP